MNNGNNKKHSTNQRPDQRVSNSMKQTKAWYIPMGEYNIKYCESHNVDKHILQTYANIANGIIQVGGYIKVASKQIGEIEKIKTVKTGELTDVNNLTTEGYYGFLSREKAIKEAFKKQNKVFLQNLSPDEIVNFNGFVKTLEKSQKISFT